MKNTIIALTLFACLGMAKTISAQTDTIGRAHHHLSTNNLKTGMKQYLVYFQRAQQSKQLYLSLWLRDVSKKTVNGESCYAISQHWYSTDTAAYRAVYSINRTSDFSPIYHAETIGNKLKAYNWYNDHINGADTVLGNTAKGFAMNFERPVLNWNLDMETYEMLDIKEGKTFVIYFYDAGIGKPTYETLKVMGNEIVTTLDNRQVDCWKLFTSAEHNKVLYTQTYWISKKNHEMLKEEDAVNGSYRYKIKLPGFAPELAKRFLRTSPQ